MMKSHSFWLVEPQLCVGERFEQIMMFGGFTVHVCFFLRVTSPTSPILVVIHISSFLGGLYSPCVLLIFSLVEIFSKLVNCAVYSPS